MHSLSGTAEPREAREVEPVLGIVPERMNYAADWHCGSTTTELFLDRARGDGYLVLLDGRQPEEHVGTVYFVAGMLRAVVWRGSATNRDEAWRASQQGMATRIVAEVFKAQERAARAAS